MDVNLETAVQNDKNKQSNAESSEKKLTWAWGKVTPVFNALTENERRVFSDLLYQTYGVCNPPP